jgi:predicted hydrocarbon binding protein
MPSSIAIAHGGVTIPAASLHVLRHALEEGGQDAAAVMQQAGFAAGSSMLTAFNAWLTSERGVDDATLLDREHLDEALSGFFGQTGWGTLTVSTLGGGLLALDSPDWAEAIPNSTQWPSCLLSSGLLPAFLGALGGHSLGAMELECRSNGGQKCRFVIGAPDNLHTLYERLALGMKLEDAVRG